MRWRSALSSSLFWLILSAESLADPPAFLDIPPGSLAAALDLLARRSHVEFVYSPDDVHGLSTQGVRGELSTELALRQLLEGTGLTMTVHPGGAILIRRNPTVSPPGPSPRTDSAPPHYEAAMEEIVVTATKRAEPLSQVAGAVSAVSGAHLEEDAAKGLFDYLGLLPGVSLQSYGHSSFDTVSIRGIAPQSVGATTAIYIDEVPVSPASAVTRGGSYAIDLDPTDLERVEVLKGPQGTLYGASSLGGVIKYVTRFPDLSRRELRLAEDLSLVDGGSPGAKLHVMASVPLIPNTLGIRISGYLRHVGGFINDSGVGGPDTNRTTDRGLRLRARYQPTGDFSVRLTALLQENRSHGNDVVDYSLITRRPIATASSQFRYVPEPAATQLQLYSAEVNYHGRRFDLVSATSFSRLLPVAQLDATQGLLDVGLTTRLTPIASLTSEPVSKVTQELRLVSKGHERLEWMIGEFYQHETLNGSYVDLYYGAAGRPIYNPPYGQLSRSGSLTEGAIFANATVFLTSQLDITAGVRDSYLRQTRTRRASGPRYYPSAPNFEEISRQDFSENADTYLAAARWRPSDALTVYARAASAYRPGGGRTPPPGAPPTLPDYYISDSLWSYETGVKFRALERRLNLDLAAFWVDWTHIQALQPIGNLTVSGNAGTARSRGLELQANFLPVKGLTLGADGAFIDARFTEAAPAIAVTAGEQLFFVPKWSAMAFASYSHAVGNGWSLQAAADYQYQSLRLDSFRAPMPAYSLWNARLTASHRHLRASLYIKNIGNEHALLGYGGAGFSAPYGFAVNTPRTVEFNLAQDF